MTDAHIPCMKNHRNVNEQEKKITECAHHDELISQKNDSKNFNHGIKSVAAVTHSHLQIPEKKGKINYMHSHGKGKKISSAHNLNITYDA